MKAQGGYSPPAYIPLSQSSPDQVSEAQQEEEAHIVHVHQAQAQWTSGICACCDDMPSCGIGLFCPSYLFAKNAKFLGSENVVGPCVTHFLLWALVNGVCCLLTDGICLGFPGCFTSCYACHYRQTLRSKYNLQESPCGDFVTHFFCHPCAVCQEYREICERSADPNFGDGKIPVVTAPPVQKMQPSAGE